MGIGIIGGGASGMILASKLKGDKATILERNGKLGKKLLLTGNGKCNFTNMNFENIKDIYNNDFAVNIIKKYDNHSFIEYIKEIGIVPKVEIHKGIEYLYPNSNKATSVYYNLLDKIKSNGIDIKYDSCVNSINKEKDKFKVYCDNGDEYTFDKLVLATGGKSYKNTGSDGKGYEIAKALGHTIENPYPGLCALKVEDKDLKSLKGVRVETKISLHNSKIDFEEVGELQFTEFGISGIPIMNLSSKISKYLDNNMVVHINYAYMIDKNITLEELNKYLKNRKEKLDYKEVKDFLCGFIPDELCAIIMDRAKVKSKKINDLSDYEINNIALNLIDFNINISRTADFDNAQVTIGGINVDEINVDTLESKIVKNLFFTGEIIDIDGKCGGYNLQLAYSTASIVADNI